MDIQQQFSDACHRGDLETVRYLLTSPELSDHPTISDSSFVWACHGGHLKVVQYLLTSPELVERGIGFANIHAESERGLMWAASFNHRDIVEYLLTSPDLPLNGHIYPDVNFSGALSEACEQGHLELVQYLLNDPVLKSLGNTADIHELDELPFRNAARFGHINIVKYLLASPDLTEHSNPKHHSKMPIDDGFTRACANGHIEVVKYLLASPDLTKYGHPPANIFATHCSVFANAFEYNNYDILEALFTSEQFKTGSNKDRIIEICYLQHKTIYMEEPTADNIKKHIQSFFEHRHLHPYITFESLLTPVAIYTGLDYFKVLLTMNDGIDIHYHGDHLFKECCLYNRTEILEFLIHDYGIDTTPALKEYFKSYSHTNLIPRMERLIHMRDLNKQLQKLPKHGNEHSKTKI